MNEEIKHKWADALTSGRYPQGQSCLRTADDRFCCLGVLIDIIDPESWNKNQVTEMGPYESYGHKDLPSEEILTKADLPIETARKLAEFNDDGMTFIDIAQRIKELK